MTKPDPIETWQRRRRRFWRIVGVLLLVAVAVTGYRVWQAVSRVNDALWGFEPPEMRAARFQKQPVLRANLGGMPVAIPWHFAEYVEYDGDPGFGEKRKGPKPVRTPESRIASFGFYMRYTDGMGLETWALRQEMKKQSLKGDSPWVDVTLISGEIFPGDGFMDVGAREALKPLNYPEDDYFLQPEKIYGLEVYVQTNIDPDTGRPFNEGKWGEDLFMARRPDGHVEAIIQCSNRKVPSPPCKHGFSMEPEARIDVSVLYSRHLLPHWKEIQAQVRRRILSFRIPPGQSESPASREAARHRREREARAQNPVDQP
ncbi:MAG TPA: hypothetical protein ENK29_02530 [Chromatiales bacterium]|nr:hypothetical protein [Chromatiales bacterium]